MCQLGETSCDNGKCISVLQQCDGQSDCSDDSDEFNCACLLGEVRLVNTTNGFTAEGIFYTGGIVEVCYTGMYGTICEQGWDERDAVVVCQQLGYSSTLYEAIPTNGSTFGSGSGIIESVDCTGSEEQLTNCAASWNVSNECLSGSRGSAGVICRQVCPDGEIPCENGECVSTLWLCDGTSDCSDSSDELDCACSIGEVRLMNMTNGFTAEGASYIGGRVEVCYNETFGTICDRGWDERDAAVVCRQLGFSPTLYEAIPTNGSAFDGGSGIIWLENVDCTGSEEQLTDCAASWNVSDEFFSSCRSAGVVCRQVCPFGESPCENGECISILQQCDGTNDCSDNSDELNCGTNGSSSTVIGGNLITFGRSQGDTRAQPTVDGSCHFALSQPFPYFGTSNANLYVNTNGILSFQEPFESFQSIPFPFDSPPLIVPYWDDVDITRFGNIYYRETDDFSLLIAVGGFIQAAFPAEGSFIPTYLFIATWDSVAQYGSGSEANTFQVVLSTNGERSFVLFLYGDIEWGSATIGFNAGDNTRSFTVPGSLSEEATEIETSSNVGVPGTYIYRVDNSVVLPNVCSPGETSCGNGECITILQQCDGQSDCSNNNDELNCACLMREVRLVNKTNGFTAESVFYTGGRVEVCYIGMYGTICDRGWDERDAAVVCQQLGFSPALYETIPTNGSTFRSGSGIIWLENVDCAGSEEQLTDCAASWNVSNECLSGSRGSAGVICRQVCPIGESPCENRECISVLQQCDGASDCSDGSDELNCATNGSRPITGIILPFGENQGDTRAPPRDDGSYHVILSQPFPYFETNNADLYVNTNGILSFQQPFESFQSIPFPFDSPPLIAPYWDDVDITRFGNIYYRETNKSSLLRALGGFVTIIFPAEGYFIPTYLFIATWDGVAQFGGGTQTNTFQVVLSTNGEKSFVFFIYGDTEWGNPTIGFNAGDRTRFLVINDSPGSSEDATELEATSNVGLPEAYIYRVDSPVVLPNGIRFEQDTYAVSESQSVEVCAGFTNEMQLQFGGIMRLSTTEGTASANEDYRTITRDLHLNPTNNRECVEISTFVDNTVEGTEEFIVQLTAANVEVASTIILIDDADSPDLRFLQPLYVVDESSGSTAVCATIDAQLQRNFTVLIQTEENTATEFADYVPVSETVVFTNDDKRHCITFEVIDDSMDEDVEELFVSTSGLDIPESIVSIRISDDDTTTFVFTESTYKFNESVANAIVCAKTVEDLERTIILNIKTSEITATDGSDYNGISRDLIFDSDHNIHCVNFPILADEFHENHESLSVVLSGPESTILSVAFCTCEDAEGVDETVRNVTFATAHVTILDDDVAGIGFEQEVYIVRESQGIAVVSIVLNVTLDETRIEATTVTEDITATAGSDYSRTTSRLAFNSGENRREFDIRMLTAYSNPSPEGAESFVITLFSEDAHLFLPNTTVVILDTHSFYPFEGRESAFTTVENVDGANSSLFHLQQKFPFFGENETIVNVNTNGIISFEVPFTDLPARKLPLENSTVALIAPFWDGTIDNRLFGTIYYRETNDSLLLQKAHEHIQQAFPLMWKFFPTSLFIATWDLIAEINSDREENTFQVVMATDGELSFVIFIYGDIQWATTTTIGFNAGDDVRSFPEGEESQPRDPKNIETTSNIGTPGVYVYRVDQPAIISPNSDNCTAGELRLVEEAIQGAEILEVCSMSEWERQCVDETWNDTSATAVCRQLGFLGGVAVECITINSTLECVQIADETGITSGDTNGSFSGSEILYSGSGNSVLGSGGTSGSVSRDESMNSSPQPSSDTPTNDSCLYVAVRCTVASVGLDEELYTVREDAGFLNVCVALDQPLERSLTVTLLTAESGEAKAFSDFNATSTPLTFQPAPSEQLQCVEIAISDDDTIESNETFLVLLTTVEQAVSLDRQYAFVTIIDDDRTIEMVTTSTGTTELLTTSIPGLLDNVPSRILPSSLTLVTTATPTLGAQPSQKRSQALPLSVGLTCGIVVLVTVLGLAVTLLILRHKRRVKRKKLRENNIGDNPMGFLNRAQLEDGLTNPYAMFQQAIKSTLQEGGNLRELSSQMLIPCKSIQLLDSIGQGEFGIVYKGHLVSGRRRGSTVRRGSTYQGAGLIEMVAVKTLKGFYDQAQVSEMLRESLKMVEFDHPNVLNLIGVCLDGGPAPYIVLPFMSNGSLLSYLKKERPNLLLGEEADEEEISATGKRLLDMCTQIAKGMEYLASKNFVHRDLAARNCMIDSSFVIKVADFGLSENTYAKTYFRQGQDTSVKLPIKWLALESLNDGVFSEKTDVWAFGVTCWEVCSTGKGPYPGIDPMTLIGMLENGHRLDKPKNAACCDEFYSIMLSCWNANPEDRPPFSELVTRISGILEPLADYMDFTSFSKQTQNITADSAVIENTSATAELVGKAAKASNLATILEDSESEL